MDTLIPAILKQIIIMFFIAAVGAVCYKVKIINDEGRKQLSALVLNVVNPMLIFMSYQTDFKEEYLIELLWAGCSALITYILFIFLARFIFKDKGDGKHIVERFSIIYSNCGFMGTPLVLGSFGLHGVFILNGFITFFHIFVWTHGVMSMSGSFEKESFLRVLRTPAIIAVFTGLICFFSRIRVPEISSSALTDIAEMTTPLAMIVAGASIMSAGLLESIRKPKVYLISLIKLLVFPAIGFLITAWLPCTETVKQIVVMAISCPCAAIGTMFALRYDRNSEYASQIFAVSTLLSAVTIPLVMMCAVTLGKELMIYG